MAGAASGTILVAEDDRAVRDALVRALVLEGYAVDAASNGAEALDRVAECEPDILLLDVSMPMVDGLTVARVLRSEQSRLPILMLTARTETSDRVAGLDAGADDYLPKPFELDELLARVRALLRRGGSTIGHLGDELIVGDLVVDEAKRSVTRGGRPVEVTKTEFDIVALLARNVDIVLSRSTMYEEIWGFDFESSSKSLDVHVGELRRKLELDGEPRIVHTVRGIGFVLRPGESAGADDHARAAASGSG